MFDSSSKISRAILQRSRTSDSLIHSQLLRSPIWRSRSEYFEVMWPPAPPRFILTTSVLFPYCYWLRPFLLSIDCTSARSYAPIIIYCSRPPPGWSIGSKVPKEFPEPDIPNARSSPALLLLSIILLVWAPEFYSAVTLIGAWPSEMLISLPGARRNISEFLGGIVVTIPPPRDSIPLICPLDAWVYCWRADYSPTFDELMYSPVFPSC